MAERNPSDDQAAFGVFPQLKRNRSQQDREAAKNIPVSQARGMVAGLLGLPADTINMIGAIRNAGRSDKPFSEIPYGSEHFLETLPLKDESPMGKAMGALGSFTPPVGTALKGAKAAGMGGLELINKGMFGEGPLRNFVPQHQFVMKPSNKANWLSGPSIHVPEGDAWRFKTQTVAGETPAQRILHHEELLKDPTLNQDQLDRVKYQLEQTKGEAALDKWADNALMGYFKGQLASPEDPVRLMIEKNYANIEAKFAKDQERAIKMAQRAEAEVDPRRKGNMKRQSETMMAQARDDRDMAMQNISHLPPEMLKDIELDPKSYIKEERVKAGYPAEGMATSNPARKWEHQADEAIKVTRAGDIQEAMKLQPKLDKALQEQYAVHYKMGQKFGDLLREKGLDEKSIEALVKSMPRDQKADAVGMLDELQKVDSNYLRLLDQDRSFPKFAAQDNPQIANLNPETKMYSGYMGDLGFEHVMDVLRQDVAAGRLRSDQLNKLSLEQAVKRTQEYNLERAKTMREAKIKQQEGFPTHKEYPEGYKWIELTTPEAKLPEGYKILPDITNYKNPGNELYSVVDDRGMGVSTGATEAEALKLFKRKEREQQLADALKYEGDTMGHCVGGYCPDVVAGNSKIYSLRDTKGEPHVTIEVQPNRYAPRHEDVMQYMGEAREQVMKDRAANNLPTTDRFPNEIDRVIEAYAVDMAKKNAPPNIAQIKGKQNAKPKDDYLPFVQDFVKSGKWSNIGDFKNTGLIREGDQIMTPAEHSDWLLKQLGQDTFDELGLGAKPPPAGMKAGGKVSISNNPDTMMLAVNNQKLAKGGKVVKFVEDVAPAAMEKLAMMFGNKLPLNMNEVENLAKRYPAPSVDRINMNYKDVTKRVPELTEAAQKLQAGELDRETYAKLVRAHKPVTPYDFVPKPATAEEARGALREDARDLYGIPSKTLEAGSPVGLRLDIPAYRDSGVWVPTIHEQDAGFGAGKKIGHESVASVLNPQFGMSEKAALSIASGKPKGTIATIKGDWNPTNEAEAVAKAKEFLKHPEWRQVGMDPERHSFFYDRETMAPVINAEEVIQIGPLVLAKNPKYGKPEDFKYAGGGLAHMAGGGSEDDADLSKPFFGGAGTKKYAAAKKRAEQADVNTLKDPRTYAAVAGLMGEAPDEMGFSVLHPDYQGIKDVAEPAYGLGIAAQVAPVIGPLTKGLPVGASIKNVSPLQSSGVFTSAMAKADAERALPLVLPRAMPKSLDEINSHAERVARQMMGEHVTSGKAGDTKNLAGRSMKESQRVKALDYELTPTKVVPESQVYQPQIGDINVALPGDFTLSDVELKSLMGEAIGSRQEGGSRYGLGHMKAKTPLFYASNEVPAQAVQNKATDLSDLFGAERIIGQHMAMGPIATNFAQHFADANLRYIDYSKLTPENMYTFDKLMAKGFEITKKNPKTGEIIVKVVDFPQWPGIANPQAAYKAMQKYPEMRKYFNKVMQTPSITEPLNLPNGLDVRYAITSPDLRDMEVNLTGHGVGQLVPNAPLTDTAKHKTYSKGIPGMYLGHQEVLTPFAISYPDAAQHIITHQRPQDFTGTIQKVFPHQRVDQQFMDEVGAYRRRIKELTGRKKGGAVKKAAGGAITGDDLIIEERPL